VRSLTLLALASSALLCDCSSAPSPDQPPESQDAAIARMEAQIKRDLQAYSSGPKKQFVGGRVESRFSEYVQRWAAKVERVGNANYPEEARGKLYGSVRVTVAIRQDGTLDSVQIDRSSGYEVLDRGALRIVQLASPFDPLPDDIRRDTDILVITRTWHFARGDKVDAAAPSPP